MKDKCILCGTETQYDQSTHIDMRVGYIEGAGQLCTSCLNSSENNIKEVEGVLITGKEIEDTPNDAELGALVRKTWYETN
jgi:hypothetical protein